MSKRFKVILGLILSHLVLCLILSFEWDFLYSGFYLGYLPTFLLLYIPSFAFFAAAYSIVDYVNCRKSRSKIKLSCALIGIFIILVFVGSYLGLFAGDVLQMLAYLSIPLGIISISTLSIIDAVKKNK